MTTYELNEKALQFAQNLRYSSLPNEVPSADVILQDAEEYLYFLRYGERSRNEVPAEAEKPKVEGTCTVFGCKGCGNAPTQTVDHDFAEVFTSLLTAAADTIYGDHAR